MARRTGSSSTSIKKEKKQCLNCGLNKPLNDFISGLDKDGRDTICTPCRKNKFGKTLDGLQRYCELSRRGFSSSLWNMCMEIAETSDKNKEAMNDMDDKEKAKYLVQKSIGLYFSKMNLVGVGDLPDSLSEAQTNREETPKFYSEKWRGDYTERDIKYLEDYYNNLEQDFNILTRNHKDYGMKIAKASLYMDQCFQEMLNGASGADKRYKDAKDAFDTLSKSAQFSESTRGQNDVVGLGSMGVIVKRIEEKGFIPTNMILDIPEDNIDKVLNDFKFIMTNNSGVV